MNVYYQNALKAADLSITGLISGENAGDLLQQDLKRTVTFASASSTISAQWTVQTTRVADALFISNTNALQGTLKLYDQNQVLRQTITLRLGRWNNKIEFPAQAVGKLELILQASGGNLSLGMVFLDLGVTLPRFSVGVDMSDELRGTGERSYGGQSYGMAGGTLETFSASWERLSSGERETMRRYIDAVQFNLNHYISPYEGIDRYVTLTEAGKWTKHDGNGFYWDTSLKYEEAK
jgi:hypothetical protein